MSDTEKVGRVSVGQVYAAQAVIGTRPFMEATFPAAAARQLAAQLMESVAAPGRHRVTITSSADLATRFRVTSTPSPAYEREAATLYLRGENLVVQGVERKSVNLDLSQDGATTLADRIDRAAAEASHVCVRVPSRRRNLVELEPCDGPSAAIADDDADAFARAGAALVGVTLPADDFADWPGAIAGEHEAFGETGEP